MSQEIIKKLDEHTGQLGNLNEKVDHLNEQVEIIAQKVLEHGKRFDRVDQQIDLLARTVADHTERLGRIEEKLEQTSTKEDISKLVGRFDEVIGLYKKKDQELTFMGEHVKRVEEKVEQNTKDIIRIKPLVGIT